MPLSTALLAQLLRSSPHQKGRFFEFIYCGRPTGRPFLLGIVCHIHFNKS
jgi:hypothetical protein